jgi:putative tryptophan/tyrosine transport system substrate-binding protein
MTMKRRQFITLLGGAGASWPLAARAQQRDGVRRIAVLMDTEETNTDGQARIAAFRQGLQQLGWTEDRNIRIDLRWGGGDVERTRAYAAEAGRDLRLRRCAARSALARDT